MYMLWQDYWTHRLAKHTGGDKSRVFNTARLDPFNVKRALDPETWGIIRYMENVVIQQVTEKGEIEGYFSCIICEDRIIFLPLCEPGLKKVMFREWGSHGFIIMVPAHEMISVGYMRGQENSAQLWGDPAWNARSQHILVKLASVPTDSSEFTELRHTAELHIFTYEPHTKVMYHLSNMWMNCFTRLKANVEVIKEESELEHAEEFYREVYRTMQQVPSATIDKQIQQLSFFASEAVNDMTLKKVFFTHGGLCMFCIKVMRTFISDLEDASASRSQCLELLRRLVCCFKVFTAVLFNSQMVVERKSVFNLGSSFHDLLEVVSQDFTQFTHNFQEKTGFSPEKLSINDKARLTNLREKRQTMVTGLRTKKGGHGRSTMAALTGVSSFDLGEVVDEAKEGAINEGNEEDSDGSWGMGSSEVSQRTQVLFSTPSPSR